VLNDREINIRFSEDEDDDLAVLFIGNLSLTMNDEELKDYFEHSGEVC
jgi:RNA recognition motif-containing protein